MFPNIEFREGDAQDLGFEDQTFDRVVAWIASFDESDKRSSRQPAPSRKPELPPGFKTRQASAQACPDGR